MMLSTIFVLCCLVNVACSNDDVNSTMAEKPKCNLQCLMGTFRNMQTSIPNCTWLCERCPPNAVTSNTNATKCTNCTEGHVSNPQRTLCSKYQTRIYDMSRAVGIIYIILAMVTVTLIIVAIFMFTKYRQHEIVVLSRYEGLCFFLFGCFLLVIAPIPLLIEPVRQLCIAYVCIFNIGLTTVFAVLMTRSSSVSSFYNENNEVIKSGLSGSPRFVVTLMPLVVQLFILIAGFSLRPLQTLIIETSEWNVGYWECSIWASYVFWIAFLFNVLLSCIGNFLSCSSTQMDELGEELKYVILSYLIFYLLALIEIILFFRVRNEALAEGQAIMCILYALGFYVFYVAPKIHVILYRTQDDGVSIKGKVRRTHDNDAAVTSLIHSKNGFQHKVIQMKVKEVRS